MFSFRSALTEHILLQRQLRWVGHAIRMTSNRLPRRLLYGELLNGQRMLGDPTLRYMDHIRRTHTTLCSFKRHLKAHLFQQ